MDVTLRLEVQELIYACEKLEKQEAVLTVKECEAILRCAKKLEKIVLPDRQRSDRPIPYPTSSESSRA
jgi:hypothetical protein